jgi:hypothetical protein
MNGWQRKGVVLLVIWIFGAGFYQRTNDMERAGSMGGWAMSVCEKSQTAKGSYDFSSCGVEFDKMFHIFAKDSWGNVAFVALAPIPLAWLAGYFIVWLSRWVRRGFAS